MGKFLRWHLSWLSIVQNSSAAFLRLSNQRTRVLGGQEIRCLCPSSTPGWQITLSILFRGGLGLAALDSVCTLGSGC